MITSVATISYFFINIEYRIIYLREERRKSFFKYLKIEIFTKNLTKFEYF